MNFELTFELDIATGHGRDPQWERDKGTKDKETKALC